MIEIIGKTENKNKVNIKRGDETEAEFGLISGSYWM
jgi:hypothetical protein